MKGRQPPRKRYDTTELVGQILRERRNGALLALAGVLSMGVLLSLYVCGIGGPSVPEVPGGTHAAMPPPPPATVPRQKDQNPAPDAKRARIPGKEAPTRATQPTAQSARRKGSEGATTGRRTSARAHIRMSSTKPTVLLVDGQRVAKGKRKTFDLAPGDHVVEARIKRRTFSRKLRFEAGRSYVMRVDATKQKIFVRRAD